jgi:hypothetical protein
MISIGLFIAGFASGWIARSSVDSSRAAAVSTLATFIGAVDRVKRAIAIEREHLEDLVAEARTQYASRRGVSGVRPSRDAVNDRAA